MLEALRARWWHPGKVLFEVTVSDPHELSFGHADEMPPSTTRWHQHAQHQLLFSIEGALELEVADGLWLLPPQRMAWISAGVSHRVVARQPVSLRTVYLATTGVEVSWPCRVFAASALAREMLLHAMRWKRGPRRDPELAELFFATLGRLALEWSEQSSGFHLPSPKSPELTCAVDWLLTHLDRDPTAELAAKAAGLSVRTLNRRFAEEVRLSFREYLRLARLLRAMELLARPGARVTEVAFAVGFESPSAFSAAFSEVVGVSPRDYRTRRQQGR